VCVLVGGRIRTGTLEEKEHQKMADEGQNVNEASSSK
jgi:hypothetical protein